MYYFFKVCSIAVLFLGLSSFTVSEDQWREYFQNDQVKIEANAGQCDNKQAGISKSYIFLRVSNKSSQKVEVSFTKELWYGETCNGCSGEETKSTVVLQPNQTIEGTCESAFKDLKIFQGMANGSKGTKQRLTKFEIKNVNVSAVK